MLPRTASLTLRLEHAEKAVRKGVEHVLREHSLTFEQWQVLAALLERPGQRMTNLAAASVLPAPSLTRHVDHLLQHALVIRRTDSADKRQVVVALSDRGERLANQLIALESRVEIDAQLAACLTQRIAVPDSFGPRLAPDSPAEVVQH